VQSVDTGVPRVHKHKGTNVAWGKFIKADDQKTDICERTPLSSHRELPIV
jgi:hypothetical protein